MAKLKKTKQGFYRRQLKGKDGKTHNLTGKTLAELAEKVSSWRASQKDIIRSDITVSEYAYQQLELMKCSISAGTYDNYFSSVKNYIAAPPLGNMRLMDVKLDDLKRAMVPLHVLSESKYSEVYSLIARIFRAALKNKLITLDPTDGLSPKGGIPMKRRQALTDEQVKILLAAVKDLYVELFCYIGIYAGMRREEILGLKWENVHLDDVDQPYIEVVTAWRIEHNRGVVTDKLKSPAAHRKIPIPQCLSDLLREKKSQAPSSAVYVYEKDGQPLSETQWFRMWKLVTDRTTAPRTYVRYRNGLKTLHTVKPKLGQHAPHNPHCVYSMDFSPTSHQLRHTYITNLCHVSDDIKTIQYLAGHEKAKTTMDIYAEVKHTDPARNMGIINKAFGSNLQP